MYTYLFFVQVKYTYNIFQKYYFFQYIVNYIVYE